MSTDETTETAVEDISDFVRKVHATYDIRVQVFPVNGKVYWIGTMSGEDFLDGYWMATREGTARTTQKALRAAVTATKKDPWVTRYRDRGEWTEAEMSADTRP